MRQGTNKNFKPGVFLAACVVCSGLLVASGVLYRRLVVQWRGTGAIEIKLPVPLEDLPKEIQGWQGQDMPIPATTEAYMRQNFADDFVSRRYQNLQKGVWADLYVVYCASRPSGILGHRPAICYPGNGWIHDSTEPSHITTLRGRDVPCLIHRFHMPAPDYREAVVLNFYLANGQVTTDEDSFIKTLGRRPNTEGDFKRYVAQIQISSIMETPVRMAAADVIDTILDFLPNEQGDVRADKQP